MRHWTWDRFARISGHWLIVVSFAAGVAETALLHTWLWPPQQTSPSVARDEIGLQILPKGTRLLVQWNPQGLPILQGHSGLLTVQDGGREVREPLDRRQLQAGSTSYTPTSEWAEFRLEIYRDGSHYRGESMALATGMSAKEKAVPADNVVVHDVPLPNSALPLPQSAASSHRSEGLGDRPSRGSTISPEVEEPRLREFSQPTPVAAINTRAPGILEESPSNIQSGHDNTALSFSLDLPHSVPLPEASLPSSFSAKSPLRTYNGVVMDAACATLASGNAGAKQDERCAISPTTSIFALRLEDGQTLRFDAVGNLRAQDAKRKNRWLVKTAAGKAIHAKVIGAKARDQLIVLSID